MKILIVSDAAPPQINGVVRTNCATEAELKRLGHSTLTIIPSMFRTFKLPRYGEICLVYRFDNIEKMIADYDPDYIHISTEGPLGWKVRNLCIRNNWAFTTAYHTDFPRYLKKHYRVPEWLTFSILRYFHSRSSAVMVSTKTIAAELRSRGFSNIVRWSRGVDTSVFRPLDREPNPVPVLTYCGRVSREKNIEAFLNVRGDYQRVVVGDGPMLEQYRRDYPEVTFTGSVSDTQELARYYNDADVFVFPSQTDTFGLVIIEAMACGTPVAAYPVQGPIDIITPESGGMNQDLESAIGDAILIDRESVSQYGSGFTWGAATLQFINNLRRR